MFRQFDYGSISENKKMYGSGTVPPLPLSNIKVPVAMLVGSKDEISNEFDTRQVYDYIKTSFFYKVYSNYDHFSWQLGLDDSYAYDVITILKKFNQLGTEEGITPIGHHSANEDLKKLGIKNLGLF